MVDVNQNNAGPPVIADTSDVEVLQVSNPDIGQGFPDTVNQTPVPVTPDAEKGAEALVDGQPGKETPVVPEKPVETTEATVERLKLQNTQNSKLLLAMGLDPMSDMAEQLEKGFITEEMVQRHVASKFNIPAPSAPAAQTETTVTDPVAIAEQNLVAAEEKYNKEIAADGTVTLETNANLRSADKALNNAKLEKLTYQITAKDRKVQVDESVDAVLTVTRENAEFVKMEKPLQNTLEQVSLGFTGLLAANKAREMGIDQTTLTPQQYRYFAGQANNELEVLAEYYRNLGREEVKAQFKIQANPQPVNTNVNVNNPTLLPQIVPENASGVPVPIVNPYAKVNHLNHKQAAADYMKRTQGIV